MTETTTTTPAAGFVVVPSSFLSTFNVIERSGVEGVPAKTHGNYPNEASARRAARRLEVKAKMARYYDLGAVLAKGEEAAK